MRNALLTTLAVLTSLASWGDFADYVYLPPESSSKAEQEAALHPIPQEAVRAYLKQSRPQHVFDWFQGKNAELAEFDDGPALRVGAIEPAPIESEMLFHAGVDEAGVAVFLAEVVSLDAYAIRLEVNLTDMAPEDEIWVIAPEMPRALGPYTAADSETGLLWLPTVAGESAVLMMRSESGAVGVGLESLVHYYVDLEKQTLPCPIPAACTTDAAYQQVSTAVGRLLVPIRGVGTLLCTGTLLNNADTAYLEALLISAHHCFDGDVNIAAMEVFWDYRASDCTGGGVPNLNSVPKSYGQALLANNACLDTEFVQLASVPNGAYGRAWLGWDTRDPVVGDLVTVNHHPEGNPLMAAFGDVTNVNVEACLDFLCADPVQRQTRVQWDEGITQRGSSGSGLLFDGHNYRLFGMLSNGPTHNCSTPETNVDNFASFREFYPQIKCYLREGVGCEEGFACGDSGWCLFKAAYGEDAQALTALRAFRDKALLPTPLGRQAVRAYYASAPALAELAQRSTAVRAAAVAMATPFAALGAQLP